MISLAYFAGAAAGLDDHRAVGPLGRLHDRQALLHIVDVEGRNAIAMLGGMIEKLPEGDTRQKRLHLRYVVLSDF
jgi:hypothetical protein